MAQSANLTWFTYASAHGSFSIQASARGVTVVSFDDKQLDGKKAASTLTNEAASQLQEYLAGKRKEFNFALDMQGSAFQKEVWNEVSAIPYGQILTASDIAARIGKAGSYRSVGTAIRQCTLAPFVPVHRIENPSATGPQAKLYRAFVALEQRTINS